MEPLLAEGLGQEAPVAGSLGECGPHQTVFRHMHVRATFPAEGGPAALQQLVMFNR